MKTLTFLSGVCLGNGVDAAPGDTHPVEDGFARSLIYRGKAVEAEQGEPSGGKQSPGGKPAPEGFKDIDDMRATELLHHAESLGIDLGMKPQDGREKILAALKEELAKKEQP